MSIKLWLSLGLTLLLTPPATAASLLLAWDWPKTHGTPTWHLSIVHTVATQTTQQMQTVTALPEAQCRTIDKAYTPATTWCAPLPCPAEGLYTLYLQADKSDPSNTVMFGVGPGCALQSYEAMYADATKPDGPVTPAAIPAEPPAAALPIDVAPIPTEADAAPIPSEAEASPTPTLVAHGPAPTAPVPAPAAPPPPIQVVTHTPVTPPPPPATATLLPPSSTTPWTSGGFADTTSSASLDPSVTHQGHPAWRVSGQGSYIGQTTSPRFAVTDAQPYDVSAWVKLDRITRQVELDIFWYDAQGGELRWSEAVGGRLSGTRDWTELRGTVTPPAGATSAVVQMRVLSQGGAAWLREDIRMQPQTTTAAPVTTPPPTPAAPPVASLVTPITPPAATTQPVQPSQTPLAVPQLTMPDSYAAIQTAYTQAQQQIQATFTQAVQQAKTPEQREHALQVGNLELTIAYWQAMYQFERYTRQQDERRGNISQK